MSNSNCEVAKFHMVRKTIMQMLNDRGYLVTNDEINVTKQQFVEHYGENLTRKSLTFLKGKQNDSTDKILVFFPSREPRKPTIGIARLKNCIERMESEGISRAIIVTEVNLTAAAKRAINEMPRISMEFFLDSELLSNVKEHVLVPEHQVLTDEEKKVVLEKYRVKETQIFWFSAAKIARY